VPNRLEFVKFVLVRTVLTSDASDRLIPDRFVPDKLELCKKDFCKLTPLKSIFLKSLFPKFDAKKSVKVMSVFSIVTPCKLEYCIIEFEISESERFAPFRLQ